MRSLEPGRDAHVENIDEAIIELSRAVRSLDTIVRNNDEIHHSQSSCCMLLSCMTCLERIIYQYSLASTETMPDFWVAISDYLPESDVVQIWNEGDRIAIRLPSLPHRYRGNQDWVAQLLSAELHMCSDLPHWHVWHADFIHLYPTNLKCIPKDVDNYSYKKVIDVIAFYLRTSDDALHFDMSMTTVYSDNYEPGVYVQITPTTIEDRPLPSPVARKDFNAPKTI